MYLIIRLNLQHKIVVDEIKLIVLIVVGWNAFGGLRTNPIHAPTHLRHPPKQTQKKEKAAYNERLTSKYTQS